MQIVGAGLGRTGTASLKLALERLLDAPCYHMFEVFQHPEHIPAWHDAARGDMPDWAALLDGYAAAVDEPASAYWPELAEAFPDALILLSSRDARSWLESCKATVFRVIRDTPPDEPSFFKDWHRMVNAMMDSRFPGMLDDAETAIRLFDAHNAHVREAVPADRLIDWTFDQGWAPICAALGVPVPDEPFPHVNSREEFVARLF